MTPRTQKARARALAAAGLDGARHQAAKVVCDLAATAQNAAPVLAALGLVAGDLKPLRLVGTVATKTRPGTSLTHPEACGCKACRQRRWRDAAREKARLDPSIVPHGTASGYNYYGCRCDDCALAKGRVVAASRKRCQDRQVQQ